MLAVCAQNASCTLNANNPQTVGVLCAISELHTDSALSADSAHIIYCPQTVYSLRTPGSRFASSGCVKTQEHRAGMLGKQVARDSAISWFIAVRAGLTDFDWIRDVFGGGRPVACRAHPK